MMLDWLGATSAAQTILTAVEQTLAAGQKTADLGGRLTTEEMGDRLILAIEKPS
jgi:isocitrate/isopropylmalate dehydrogenase